MTAIITATYPNGSLDEQHVCMWGNSTPVVNIGHGPILLRSTELKCGDTSILARVYGLHHREVQPELNVTYRAPGESWKPKVGDGCSFGWGGDRYPYTVRRISPSGKTIWVSRDGYKVKPGHGGMVEGNRECFFYPLDDTPDVDWMAFKLKSDGKFRFAGKSSKRDPSLNPGRVFSNDPSF